jgi:hypothetical protein
LLDADKQRFAQVGLNKGDARHALKPHAYRATGQNSRPYL